MPSTFTEFSKLEKAEQNAVGWNAANSQNLDAIDFGIRANYYKVLLAEEVTALHQLLGWSPSDDNVMVLAKTHASTPIQARAVALETGEVGDLITVMGRGWIEHSGWSFTRGDTIYVSTTPGAIVDDTDPTLYIADADPELNFQSVGIATAADRVFFDFQQRQRGVSYMVGSSRIANDGGPVTESFAFIGGTRYALVWAQNSASPTRLYYAFVLPSNFKRFPSIGAWCFRIWYVTTGGTAKVTIKAVHDGAGNQQTTGLPAAGTSTSWAALDLNMDDLTVSGFESGKPFYVDLELLGDGTNYASIESAAQVRYEPLASGW